MHLANISPNLSLCMCAYLSKWKIKIFIVLSKIKNPLCYKCSIPKRLCSGNHHNPSEIVYIMIRNHCAPIFPQIVHMVKKSVNLLLCVTSLTFAPLSVLVIKCNILKSQSSEKNINPCLTAAVWLWKHMHFLFKHLPSKFPKGLDWRTPASLHLVPITEPKLQNYKNRSSVQL